MATVEQLEKVARRLRIYSLKMTTEAGSGHPTTCLSMAEIMACLFFDEMHYDIKNPHGYNNDEFVLSKGHAAPILWAAYAEAGIIKRRDIHTLRKITSNLEGHPTPRMPWVKAATGSLGQGLSVGVGLALAMKLDKSGARTYVVLGDGECAEGNIWEAANSAAYYKLDNLCAIVDVNRLGQSGETMHGHDIRAYVRKFEAFGWHAVAVNGHSVRDLLKAFSEFNRSRMPTAIIAKTFKGHGVSFIEDKNGFHGKPLTGDQLKDALAGLRLMPRVYTESLVKRPRRKKKPRFKKGFSFTVKGYQNAEKIATREAYGHALTALGRVNQYVAALDGDVKNSTGEEEFFKEFPERSFESFIAEQNMVGMAIGLSARGFIPFAASFACFLERAHDQIRMAAYSFSNLKLVGSHVGVSIGEDGPSQMGLEDLAMFRVIPDSLIFYPSDAYSTVACVKIMAEHKGISYLRTTRPKTPVIYKRSEKFKIGGSKVLKRNKKDRVTVVAAGITVHNVLEAYEMLKSHGIYIRIIDAYSIKPLDANGIIKNIRDTRRKVIVIEDHFEEGGLGEAVKSAIADAGGRFEIQHLSIRELPRSGSPLALMKRYGISRGEIIKAVHRLI